MSEGPRLVRYEAVDGVSIITLDRTPLNVYDGLFHVEFQDAWRRAREDPATRVVLMRATGRHFCAGANLGDPQPAPGGRSELHPVEEIRLIKQTMKPTIAAVQGGCVGGGQRMVWPCDIVFCTEDAFFSDPTAQMGIGGIQSHLHTWFYGARLAKEMIYGSMRLPAGRLYAMGQVNRLCPDLEALHAEALAFATHVATQDPVALRQAKRASDTTMDIQGQHYVLSRMEELLDESPTFKFPNR
jgi:enoyl-CoA hydratase/carnithine racemase